MSNEYNHIRAERILDAPVVQRGEFVVLEHSCGEIIMTKAGAKNMAKALEKAAE